MANNRKRILSTEFRPANPQLSHQSVRDDTEMREPESSDNLRKKVKEDLDLQGVPPEMGVLLAEQMGLLDMAVSNTLSKYKPSGSESNPWASEWKTERLWIAAPLSGISVEYNLIDQVILSVVASSPTSVTITAGKGAEDLPALSVEDERFLTGILTAVRGRKAPTTLRCSSSSIIDLTFYALWNLASARLVNNRERRGSIHPSVLPDKPIRGGKASEYLNGRILSLKATLGTNYSYIADTIERVIKVWSEASSELTRDLLASIKIPWGLVLSRGGEYKVSERKQGRSKILVRNLVTPINPKESAWVMPAERKILSHLCAPVWSRIDGYQKEWVNLPEGATHPLFDSFVDKVRLAYKEMHRLSESLSKRLGQRKAVILNAPVIRKLSKKELKNKKSNDLLILFSKTDLSLLPVGAKAVFEPFFAASAFEGVEELMSHLKGVHIRALLDDYAGLCEVATPTQKLFLKWEKWWVDTFQPPMTLSFKDVPKNALETSNLFDPLSEDMEQT